MQIIHYGGRNVDEKKVNLRMKELDKYNVIKELVDHNGNKKQCST